MADRIISRPPTTDKQAYLAWFNTLTIAERDAELDELFDQYMRQPDWEEKQRQEEWCWQRQVAVKLGVGSVVGWN